MYIKKVYTLHVTHIHVQRILLSNVLVCVEILQLSLVPSSIQVEKYYPSLATATFVELLLYVAVACVVLVTTAERIFM